MGKVRFTNQHYNRVDIIASHYTSKKSIKPLHWKHIPMWIALISPSKTNLPFNASYAIIFTKTKTP
jgi:hypothetical protein